MPPEERDVAEELRARMADADLLRLEDLYRAEYEQAVAEGERLCRAAYQELLEGEIELCVLDGMRRTAAEGAARVNLTLRRTALQEELHALILYHRGRYLRRLRELVAMQGDRRVEE
jgi:hypothetical protein